jgi:1-acyl-sn-glycerol-3-phosphate acyltransferase
VLLGQEHLPGLVGCGRPLLFVGNHQKCGLYDMPLLAYELYLRGFKVRLCWLYVP